MGEYLVTNQNQLIDYQIEDAAMGIWTQKMAAIDRVNLRVSAYVSYCEDGPDLIWVNPLEPDELERLADSVLQGDMCSNFATPQTCIKNPCLCTPKGEDCNTEEGGGSTPGGNIRKASTRSMATSGFSKSTK